ETALSKLEARVPLTLFEPMTSVDVAGMVTRPLVFVGGTLKKLLKLETLSTDTREVATGDRKAIATTAVVSVRRVDDPSRSPEYAVVDVGLRIADITPGKGTLPSTPESAETGTTSPATVPDMPESSGAKVRITPQMLETMADHGLRFPSELAESATVSYVGRTSEARPTTRKQSTAVPGAEGSDATIGGGVYFGKGWKPLNSARIGGAHAEASCGSSNGRCYTTIDVEQPRTAISPT